MQRIASAIKEDVMQIRRLCTVSAPDKLKENLENKDTKVDPKDWHDKEDEWMQAWDDITGEMFDSNDSGNPDKINLLRN